MEPSTSQTEETEVAMERLIGSLNSLQEGERAEHMLVAAGQRAVPYLREFLLHTNPRSIATPRCRAARALGTIGDQTTLREYLSQDQSPQNAVVLFAEDAVRSMAACELMQWPSEANFETLLKAAGHRATGGLILALGNYARPESVPLLFRTLEDDLCREEAMSALRKTPDAMRDYALRSLSGMFGAPPRGGSTRARCRATLRLLLDLGVAPKDWKALRPFLADHDSSIVLTVSQIGFQAAPCEETPEIMRRLISAADRFNWLEERDAAELLLAQGHLVHSLAAEIMQHRKRLGLQPDPQMPSWRILHRVADGPVREPPHETASI